MRRTQVHCVVGVVIVVMLLVPTTVTPLNAQDPPPTPSDSSVEGDITIDFDWIDVAGQFREPISTAMSSGRAFLPRTSQFTVTALRSTADWMHAVLVPTHVVESGWEGGPTPEEVREVLGHRLASGEWVAYVQGSPGFLTAALEVPRDFIDFSYLRTAQTASQEAPSQVAVESRLPIPPLFPVQYRFPWTAGQMWYKLRAPYPEPWHSGYSIDFQPKNRSNPSDLAVLAAAPGTLVLECGGPQPGTNDAYQARLYINTSDGPTWYIHMDARSIRTDLIGKHIVQGQFLGRIYNHDGYFNTPCGYGIGAHLHFSLPRPDVVIDGHNANDVANSAKNTLYTSTNIRDDFNGCSPWGYPNYAVLYLHAGYDSGDEGYPLGCARLPLIDGSEFTLHSSFGASSVRIPPGYYLDLHERGGNGFARMYCEDEADNASFVDNWFISVGNWPPPLIRFSPVNDRVGGVTVHSGSCGQPPGLGGGGGGGGMDSTASASDCPVNNPPLAPSLQSPGNGYVATNYRAPTLCWNRNGDPDGDQTYFYAEVYDSPINANSGPINGTCWRPGQLDYQYHTYQWRVKAKDARGAEGGWSETWSFRVAPPNYPPSISFDSANGNTFPSGSIDTREGNWTFRGTASDPEGQLSRVEWRCSGDNCGWQAGHTNGTSWSHTRNGMSGQNDVYFVAYDNVGNYTFSRHLNLRIDQAAPATRASLNNEANPAYWPTWFTGPVPVRLYAVDGNTGRARVGVREVRYQLDSGAWQTQGGDTVNFTVSSDGAHSVAFYAVDHLGNTEGVRTVSFQIDQTPPNPPGGVVETNGVLNNQWQKAHNTPTFTWAASTDATSGVWGYQFYFGEDPNGQGYQTFTAADPRQWTPQPGGVHTGVYYLRGRARDNAGNWSAWTTAFIYRYDGTPPENPSAVTHTAGITSTVWQRITNTADFNWLVPYDEGSGVKGYYGYWGTDPNGVSTNLLTTNRFQDPTPLCDLNGACTGYLRLRSVDNVDNLANEWSTAFVLRYDNVPPTVDFTFNRGVTQTGQTQVTLNIIASDEGSGVRAMRFSTDGQNWTPWEDYADERPWIVPPISRQAWPVYVQVQDEVGLTSAVISHTVYLDVNRQAPRSVNFWLFDNAISAGTGGYTSTTHTGRGTLGQVMDSPAVTSTHFVLWNGYEAGSQAVPIMEPAHEDYDFVNGIFASGNVATTMTSTLYVMIGTYGEVGLSNDTTMTSANFQHQPGFLAAEPWIESAPVFEPGPAPQPEPPLACKTPLIRINENAAFTNDVRVTLSICAPGAVEMMIGSSETLTDTVWEPYAELKTWTLLVPGQFVQPAFVYAAFNDADGTVYGTYFDDVIYDPNQPSGSVMVGDSVPGGSHRLMSSGGSEVQAAAASAATFRVGNVVYARQVGGVVLEEPLPVLPANPDGSVNIFVDGYDDNSGISEMQLGGSDDFTGIAWEPFAAVMQWTPPGEEDGVKTVFARVHDNAGNISAVSSVDFVFDSQPPLGELAFTQRVAGVEAVTATVYFGADDNYSGVTDMRFGHTPDLADAAWQPYTDTMVVPISPTLSSPETLYAQYRDLAGNVSEIYSDTLVVDNVPPIVYVDVEVGKALTGTGTITMPTTFTRTVTVAAYDELADVILMYLSNDPLMIDGVATLPYTETVSWVFDERRVVWAQAEDSVRNVSDPYPAYAREAPPLPNKVYLPLIVK